MSLRTRLSYIQNGFPQQKTSCGCRNSSDYTNLWPILKPIGSWRIVCMLIAMHLGGRKRVPSYYTILKPSYVNAFFLQHLWRNMRRSGNFPRFLKSVIHIPEKQHLGLASLLLQLDLMPVSKTFSCVCFA